MTIAANAFNASNGNAFLASPGNARGYRVEQEEPPFEPSCPVMSFEHVLYQGELRAYCGWVSRTGYPSHFDVEINHPTTGVPEVLRFEHFYSDTSQWTYAPSDPQFVQYYIAESWYATDSLGQNWLAQATFYWDLVNQGSAPGPVRRPPSHTWHLSQWNGEPDGSAPQVFGGSIQNLNPFYPSPKSMWGNPDPLTGGFGGQTYVINRLFGLRYQLEFADEFSSPLANEMIRLTDCELVCYPTRADVTLSGFVDEGGISFSQLNGTHTLWYWYSPPSSAVPSFEGPYEGFFADQLYDHPDYAHSIGVSPYIATIAMYGSPTGWNLKINIFYSDSIVGRYQIGTLWDQQLTGDKGFWGNQHLVSPFTGTRSGFGGMSGGLGSSGSAAISGEVFFYP